MPKIVRFDKDEALTDWKTGKYTVRDLASKYKVSPGTIHKLVVGVDKSLAPLINKAVEIKQELTNFNEREINRFEQEVRERTKHIQFFTSANALIAKTVINKVQADGDEASYQDLNAAANAITKAQENVLGKQPDSVVNVGVTQRTVIQSADRVREIRQKLIRDICGE
jgi:poly-D-alanine transfer protein DltD